MSGFYIKKVMAHSDEKGTSSVDLINGLNIIQGRSDSGKTCVVKCIEFVFGGDMNNLKTPFKASSGYNKASLVLGTDEGDVTIVRKVGSNQVTVSAPGIDWIEDGVYALKKPSKPPKKPKPLLNEVMMGLIGFEDIPQVTINSLFEKGDMTWTNLLRLFYVKEGRIFTETSLIEPQENYEKTRFLSSLLYLIYGHDFGTEEVQTKDEIKKARRAAVKDYLNEKIQAAARRREALAAQAQVFKGVNVEEQIADMVTSFNATEEAITAALQKSKDLLAEIMNRENRLAQCNVLLSRYKYLKSQYKADIKRLSFIVEGEVETLSLPRASTCPFCEGEILPRSRKTYIDASRAELARIVDQMEGLDTTEQNVQREKTDIENALVELRSQRDSIERLISEDLKPKSAALSEGIASMKAYIRLTEEIRIVEDYAQSWAVDIDTFEATTESGTKVEYHAKECFDSNFQSGMTENAETILKDCNYPNFTAARFNMTSFDIEVNGEPKGSSHGKGYCSYLNTIVALMFRKYMQEHAVFNPNLLIVDTPLLGLDEEKPEDVPASMTDGLFNYFIKHQGGQMIIIENLNEIPQLEYEANGANVITFTKKIGEGRYGFLNGVYQ